MLRLIIAIPASIAFLLLGTQLVVDIYNKTPIIWQDSGFGGRLLIIAKLWFFYLPTVPTTFLLPYFLFFAKEEYSLGARKENRTMVVLLSTGLFMYLISTGFTSGWFYPHYPTFLDFIISTYFLMAILWASKSPIKWSDIKSDLARMQEFCFSLIGLGVTLATTGIISKPENYTGRTLLSLIMNSGGAMRPEEDYYMISSLLNFVGILLISYCVYSFIYQQQKNYCENNL